MHVDKFDAVRRSRREISQNCCIWKFRGSEAALEGKKFALPSWQHCSQNFPAVAPSTIYNWSEKFVEDSLQNSQATFSRPTCPALPAREERSCSKQREGISQEIAKYVVFKIQTQQIEVFCVCWAVRRYRNFSMLDEIWWILHISIWTFPQNTKTNVLGLHSQHAAHLLLGQSHCGSTSGSHRIEKVRRQIMHPVQTVLKARKCHNSSFPVDWEASLRCCLLTSTCISLLWWLCSRTSANINILLSFRPFAHCRTSNGLRGKCKIDLHVPVPLWSARALREGLQAGVLSPMRKFESSKMAPKTVSSPLRSWHKAVPLGLAARWSCFLGTSPNEEPLNLF